MKIFFLPFPRKIASQSRGRQNMVPAFSELSAGRRADLFSGSWPSEVLTKEAGAKINNFKFLIELSITQFSKFFNFKIIEKFTSFGGKFSLFEFRKRKRATRTCLVALNWPLARASLWASFSLLPSSTLDWRAQQSSRRVERWLRDFYDSRNRASATSHYWNRSCEDPRSGESHQRLDL